MKELCFFNVFLLKKSKKNCLIHNYKYKKNEVLSVQLGKTLSFVKIVVKWGGVEEGLKFWSVVH